MTSWFAKVQQHIGGCRFSARPVDRPFADDCKPLLSDRLFMIFRNSVFSAMRHLFLFVLAASR
jgi:hypothetical protein